jgi:hypothetical protein
MASAPSRFEPFTPPRYKSETLWLGPACCVGCISNFVLLLDVYPHIFVIYIGRVWVAQNRKCWMAGWLVNSFWKGCGSKQSWSNLKYFTEIFLERLRKRTNILTSGIFSVSLRFEPNTSRVQVGNFMSWANILRRVHTSPFLSLCLYITCNVLNFIHFYNEDGGIIFLTGKCNTCPDGPCVCFVNSNVMHSQ